MNGPIGFCRPNLYPSTCRRHNLNQSLRSTLVISRRSCRALITVSGELTSGGSSFGTPLGRLGVKATHPTYTSPRAWGGTRSDRRHLLLPTVVGGSTSRPEFVMAVPSTAA